MGLDIYAGTMVRYYSRNWKTSVQQWGEANGVQVNIIRPEEQNAAPVPVEEITADVISWREQLIQALAGELTGQPHWNEDNNTTPYYTDKPDWDALNALRLYALCKLQERKVPDTVDKNFDIQKQPAYKKFIKDQNTAISLLHCSGWWLPISDSFMFNGYLPTGHQRMIATTGMLREELERINAIEWNADEQTIIGWRDTEGYPTDALWKNGQMEHIAKHKVFDTVSLAKFAFSILWQAVRHSMQYGTLIIYDY